MDEIAIELLKLIMRILLFIFRLIVYITWELMCEKMLWYLGWPVSRIITLGVFPHESISNSEQAHPMTLIIVALIGLTYPTAITYYLVDMLIGE